MNVNVTLEHRFILYNNTLYTDGAFSPDFWKRYLEVFSSVTIIARAKRIENLSGKEILVSSDIIKFIPLPFYIGLQGKILKHFEVKRIIKKVAEDKTSAFILRVGSPIADILAPELRRNNIKYAVEVVGDPWDVFAPGAIENPLRPLMRRYFAYKLSRQCLYANYASYVTEFALQRRYPSPESLKSINASSIDLGEDFFFLKEKEKFNQKKWLFVGTLEQYQKAPDILLKAFAKLKELDISLTFIGDGRKRKDLEEMVRELGLTSVSFIGKLKNSDEVRDYLCDYGFFVLPSRGEGLPRAMIEAMACSCVCIGSDIGGIKELLSDDFIAKAGDIDELAQRIETISKMNTTELVSIGERNYNEAKKYLNTKLNKRRKDFYKFIKQDKVKE